MKKLEQTLRSNKLCSSNKKYWKFIKMCNEIQSNFLEDVQQKHSSGVQPLKMNILTLSTFPLFYLQSQSNQMQINLHEN